MKALELDRARQTVRVTEKPKPEPAEGEALVRVLIAGICNTDLELAQGYMDFNGIPGHEFAGVVEECANDHLRGQRVVGEINCVCHQCAYCRMEMPHHCVNRTVLGILNRDGAFAEYITLPEENLHIIPKRVPEEAAAFAEPVAAAFRITEQVRIEDGQRVVVLGDGKLGQLIAQVLWLRTKQLVCVGRHRWKLDLLAPLGIATALDTDPIEPGADLVVEVTGTPEGLNRALELVRPEGAVVLKTTVAQGAPIDMSRPVINEITIVGSRCGPFRPAVEALALGNVEVRPLISATYPLTEGPAAFEHARRKDAIKVLLQP